MANRDSSLAEGEGQGQRGEWGSGREVNGGGATQHTQGACTLHCNRQKLDVKFRPPKHTPQIYIAWLGHEPHTALTLR